MVDNVQPLFGGYGRPHATSKPKEPPHNVRLEQAILGAILTTPKAFDEVADFLLPEHFYLDVHARTYAEVARRIVSGQSVDMLSMDPWLASDPDAATLPGGSRAYLLSLPDARVSLRIRHYGEQLHELHIRRVVAKRCTQLKESAYNTQIPIEQITTDLTNAIDEAVVGDDGARLRSFDDVLDEAIAKAETTPDEIRSWVIIRGFPTLSRILSFQPTQMTLLGGRQGEGKSALAMDWAVEAARSLRDSGLPLETTGGIVVVSADMDDVMIGERALAAVAAVDVNSIVERRLTSEDVRRLKDAREELRGLPLKVIGGSRLTTTAITMRLRQARRALKGHIRLIVGDHFHRFMLDPKDIKTGGTGFAYTRNADVVHGWCKKEQFNCHVLMLVQLNIKEMAKRAKKVPTRDDILWTSQLVSNADNILFVYRPIMDEPNTPPKQDPGEYPNEWRKRIQEWEDRRRRLLNQAMLVIDKMRSGGNDLGHIPLLFDGRYTKLTEDPSGGERDYAE